MRRPSILVVEDNNVNRMVVRTLLKPLGSDVTMVENGRAAVEAVAAAVFDAFDVILMDIQMPELDGIAATRAIRAIEDAAPVRHTRVIIATTANTMTHQVERYRQSGMQAWLSKPVRRADLFGLMVDFLPSDPIHA